MEDKCICCGAIVPEGRQVCISCEAGGNQMPITIIEKNEPTREQIIKACECCKSKYADCENCPFYCFAMNECGDCVEAIVCGTEKLLISDSTRIAELEAENKRLKEGIRWIPFSEREPTEQDANKDRQILSYSAALDKATMCTWYHAIKDGYSTHWMKVPELPQPPKKARK